MKDTARRKRVAEAPSLQPDKDLIAGWLARHQVTLCPARTYSQDLVQPMRHPPAPKKSQLRKALSS